MVDYVRLSCGIGSGTPDASGRYDMEITGTCFYGSFGAVDRVQPIGFTYLARAKVEGLDYQSTYEFQARATDKLAAAASALNTFNAYFIVPVTLDFSKF